MTNQTKEPVLITPKMIEKEWDISNCKRGYNQALQDVEKMIDDLRYNLQDNPYSILQELKSKIKNLSPQETGYGGSTPHKTADTIIKWLKDIVMCNAHDKAWIEQTIKKLEQLEGKK